MPKGMRKNEGMYYQYTHFTAAEKIYGLNIQKIKSRDVKVLYEKHNMYTTDYFFFLYNGERYFGRKTLSQLHLSGVQKSKKCSQITTQMLIGLVIRDQITEQGVLISFKPLENSEKRYIFDAIKQNPNTDLWFPYPYLINGKEFLQPDNVWNPTLEQVRNLDGGEEVLRRYTTQVLSKFDTQDKIVFDPACSTGKFLTSIKLTFPVFTIGQDLNSDMVQYAKTHGAIDRLIHGDSMNTPIEDNSVDFVFFRFLNSAVVTTNQAAALFSKLANKCRDGGYLIVFGHTPVLLSSEWFQILGLDVLQCIGYDENEDSIFQYYVLKKTKPVPPFDFDKFSVFNFSDDAMKLAASVKIIGHQVILVPLSKSTNQEKDLKCKL